jgi:hypothetical protein
MESWETRPPELPYASVTSARVCGRSGFWGSVAATARWYDLLPSGAVHQNIFFLVVLLIVYFYFLMDAQGTVVQTPTYIDWGPRLRAMSCVNGAPSALIMDPSVGYNPFFECVKFNIIFAMINMFIIVATGRTHVHIFVVTNWLLFLGLNLIWICTIS